MAILIEFQDISQLGFSPYVSHTEVVGITELMRRKVKAMVSPASRILPEETTPASDYL